MVFFLFVSLFFFSCFETEAAASRLELEKPAGARRTRESPGDLNTLKGEVQPASPAHRTNTRVRARPKGSGKGNTERISLNQPASGVGVLHPGRHKGKRPWGPSPADPGNSRRYPRSCCSPVPCPPACRASLLPRGRGSPAAKHCKQDWFNIPAGTALHTHTRRRRCSVRCQALSLSVLGSAPRSSVHAAPLVSQQPSAPAPCRRICQGCKVLLSARKVLGQRQHQDPSPQVEG